MNYGSGSMETGGKEKSSMGQAYPLTISGTQSRELYESGITSLKNC